MPEGVPTGALVLLLVLPGRAQDEDGWHREYYPDGALRVEVEVVPGWNDTLVRDGKFRRLAPDGVVLAEGRYKDGRPRGKWTFRHPNGKERAQGFYDGGVPAREWKLRRPDGKIWAQGAVAAESDGETPFPPGDWEFRDAAGAVDPVLSGRYTSAVTRWPSGALREAGSVLDGAPHGPWVGWWEDGSPRESGAYVRGERVGPWRFRHSDGARDDALLGAAGAAPEWPDFPSIEGEAEESSEESLWEDSASGDLPRLAGPPQEPVRGLLESLSRLGQRERDEAQRIVARDAPVLAPFLIDALAAIDLADPAAAARAHGLAEGLAAACGGRGFGWRAGTDAAAVAENRARVRSWHSLWSLTAEDRVLWRIAFAAPPAKGESLLDFGRLSRPVLPLAVDPPAAGAEPELLLGMERALEWLAAHQERDGHWSPDDFGARCEIHGGEVCSGAGQDGRDVGITALAALAFLRAGQGPASGTHADAVARALGWLLGEQQESGLFGRQSRQDHIYSHCAAVWTLAEAASADLVQRAPNLLPALARAVAVIERARNTGEGAGWRYELEPNGDADTSVTGWAAHALLAARRAGVEVDPAAIASALALVERMTGADGRVGYDSMGSRSARTPSNAERFPHDMAGEALTAIGVLVRFGAAEALGTPADEVALKRHAALLRKLPRWDPVGGRDFYWWFWGAQAARRLGGATWKPWPDALRQEVLHHQEPHGGARGSWEPDSAWGHVGGRVYATAVLALCLTEAARAQ